jgi:hypothetical protein
VTHNNLPSCVWHVPTAFLGVLGISEGLVPVLFRGVKFPPNAPAGRKPDAPLKFIVQDSPSALPAHALSWACSRACPIACACSGVMLKPRPNPFAPCGPAPAAPAGGAPAPCSLPPPPPPKSTHPAASSASARTAKTKGILAFKRDTFYHS